MRRADEGGLRLGRRRPERSSRSALVAAGLLVATAAAGCRSEPPRGGGAEPLEVPLEALAGGGLSVSVGIAGGTHRMLFDVGAGLTLLTAESARDLGCRPWGRVLLRSAGGESRALPRCGEMSLSLGRLSLSAPTAVLDPAPASLAAAQLSGVASLQTLGARPVTLDVGRTRLVIESDASLAARTSAMRPLEARVGREAAGLATRVFLAAGTPRGPLWLLLSGSGDARTAIAPHTLPLLGVDPHTPPGAEVAISLDLPGLGRIEQTAVVAEGPWDGVLDAAVLERLVLTVDLRYGQAWARWTES